MLLNHLKQQRDVVLPEKVNKAVQNLLVPLRNMHLQWNYSEPCVGVTPFQYLLDCPWSM